MPKIPTIDSPHGVTWCTPLRSTGRRVAGATVALMALIAMAIVPVGEAEADPAVR